MGTFPARYLALPNRRLLVNLIQFVLHLLLSLFILDQLPQVSGRGEVHHVP